MNCLLACANAQPIWLQVYVIAQELRKLGLSLFQGLLVLSFRSGIGGDFRDAAKS
jgi:hypothetical protein